MEALHLDDCVDEGVPQKRVPFSTNTRAHTIHPSSAIVIKSGTLSKKGLGFTGNRYRSYFFELHENGELCYFETKRNGQRVKKGEIMITSSTRIEKRSGGTRRDAKLIIHSRKRQPVALPPRVY